MQLNNAQTLWTLLLIKSARYVIAWIEYAVMLTKRLLNSLKTAVIIAVLAGLVTAGCATKTVIVKLECEVPQLAPLPVIMSKDMEMLSDDVYWALMDRERLLTDWALEMEAQLEVLCKKNPN